MVSGKGEPSGEANGLKKPFASALDSLGDIMKLVKDKKPVFFLDYDGTLTPIVEIPDQAFMPEASRNAVKKLSEKFTTAIVSGRGKEKVKAFVQLENLFYAGSHGLDISGPENSPIEFKKFEAFKREFKDGTEALSQRLKGIPGAFVENNYLSLSVHYRASDPNDVPRIEEIVDNFLLTDLGSHMKKSQGKKVFELKLKTNWHKGAALLHILETLKFDSDENTIPFYIGDDVTDEDAFEAINQLGRGVPILVSENPGSRPTLAQYTLRDTSEVQQFLLSFSNMFDEDANN